MEQFRSPNEITTLFLVFSIAFYVFVFWRSQLPGKPAMQNRRKPNSRPQIHPRRRASDRTNVETLVINQLFEEDDERSATNH